MAQGYASVARQRPSYSSRECRSPPRALQTQPRNPSRTDQSGYFFRTRSSSSSLLRSEGGNWLIQWYGLHA